MITPQLCLSFAVITFGASFQFGYQTGVVNAPSAILSGFIRNVTISRNQNATEEFVRGMSSLLVAGFPIGGIFGALLGGYISNRFGRKMSLLLFSIPTLIGSILIMLARVSNSFEIVIIGRLILGIACGAYTGIAPTLLSEFAPSGIKGASGILNQLSICAALLVSQILGIPALLGTDEYWPFLLGFSLFPCLVQLAILPFLPESPRYLLLAKRDTSSAKKALKWLRGPNYNIEIEIHDLSDELSASGEESKNLAEFMKLSYLRMALMVAIVVHLSQQLCGINAVNQYSTDLFRQSGIPKENAIFATLGVGITLFVFTFISVFLVDKVGRRKLHLTGLLVMFISAIVLVICLVLKKNLPSLVYLSLVSVYSFVGGFSIGPGAIPWFIVAEMFTQDTRDVAITISVVVNWIGQILIFVGYPQLLEYLGDYSFVPFIVFLGIFLFVLYKYMPETKDRSPTYLENMFKRRVNFEETVKSDNEQLDSDNDNLDTSALKTS